METEQKNQDGIVERGMVYAVEDCSKRKNNSVLMEEWNVWN